MRYVILVLLLFSLSKISKAETEKNINVIAQNFINSHQYQQAYDILKEAYLQKKYDNQSLFLLAQTSKEIRKFEESIQYFQELIANGGDTGYARYELAMTYMNNKEYDKANEQFKLAKNDNPPEKNLKDIELNLYRTKPWRVNANIGYMYDSNANVGTNANNILLFNLPFTLSDNAKQTADSGFVSRMGFEYQKQIRKNLSWYSNFGFGNTSYLNLQDFDLLSLNGQTGLILEQGRFTYSLPVIANWLKVGHTDSYYNYTYGIAPQIRTRITQNIVFDNQFIVQQREYKTYTSRTGYNLTYHPSFKYFFSQQHFIGLGGILGRDDVQAKFFSNKAYLE